MQCLWQAQLLIVHVSGSTLSIILVFCLQYRGSSPTLSCLIIQKPTVHISTCMSSLITFKIHQNKKIYADKKLRELQSTPNNNSKSNNNKQKEIMKHKELPEHVKTVNARSHLCCTHSLKHTPTRKQQLNKG